MDSFGLCPLASSRSCYLSAAVWAHQTRRVSLRRRPSAAGVVRFDVRDELFKANRVERSGGRRKISEIRELGGACGMARSRGVTRLFGGVRVSRTSGSSPRHAWRVKNDR